MTRLALTCFSFFEFIFTQQAISICINAIQINILLFLELAVHSIVSYTFIRITDQLNFHLSILISHFKIGMCIKLMYINLIFLINGVLRITCCRIFVLFTICFIMIKIIFNMMKLCKLIFISELY